MARCIVVESFALLWVTLRVPVAPAVVFMSAITKDELSSLSVSEPDEYVEFPTRCARMQISAAPSVVVVIEFHVNGLLPTLSCFTSLVQSSGSPVAIAPVIRQTKPKLSVLACVHVQSDGSLDARLYANTVLDTRLIGSTTLVIKVHPDGSVTETSG